MEYNKYAVFLEVARQQNISKAARVLGYTQSGISHTIKRMEEEMGLSLFFRDRNGAILTSAGREIYPYVAQMVQCEENLNQRIQSLHDLHQGTLTIGTYSSVARQWLPGIIRRFKDDYPEVKINFREGGAQEIFEWIANREVDFGFVSEIENKNYEWIALADDPLLAVLSLEEVTDPEVPGYAMDNFNDRTFILSTLGVDIDIHKAIETAGIHPDVQYTAKDELTIISMVSCGLGVSILPKLVLDSVDSSVQTRELDPPVYRQLGIAIPSKETASPAALKFIQYTVEYIKSL